MKAREDAALAKKQAKLDRGVGKKKKGGLARMKKGSGLADEDAVEAEGEGSDGDEPGTRKDQRKADKKAEHREQVEARHAQREAVRECAIHPSPLASHDSPYVTGHKRAW